MFNGNTTKSAFIWVSECVLCWMFERQFGGRKFPEIEIFMKINIKEKPHASQRASIKSRYEKGAANSNYETVRMDVVVSLLLLLLVWSVAVSFSLLLSVCLLMITDSQNIAHTGRCSALKLEVFVV